MITIASVHQLALPVGGGHGEVFVLKGARLEASEDRQKRASFKVPWVSPLCVSGQRVGTSSLVAQGRMNALRIHKQSLSLW